MQRKALDNLDEDLLEIAAQVADFEPEPTQEGKPAGEVQGGRQFEQKVSHALCEFLQVMRKRGGILGKVIVCHTPNRPGIIQQAVACINRDKGAVILFCFPFLGCIEDASSCFVFLKSLLPILTKYSCKELYDCYVEALQLKGHLPKNVSFLDYRKLYEELFTIYDGIVLLGKVEVGRLCEVPSFDEVESFILKEVFAKYLVEVKVAKSSKGVRIDGNAHERLSYQNLEYLNISLREPKTNLLVLANSAFVKYKNKYHAGFGVHGVLLEAAFPSYAFKMVCSRDQYVALFKDWANWLL